MSTLALQPQPQRACIVLTDAAGYTARETAGAADVSAAPVLERLKPLLRYVGKLTVSPAKITPADARAVLAAGWEERALHDAVAVCGLFNLMNRLVEGLGITAGEDYFRAAARRLAAAGYSGLKDLL